jgi:ATP-dependent Lon protease
VPEGATPKDGPSAGVAMITALVSLLSGRPVRPRVAMTGEISLAGIVLPVGGIKEKVLGAKRAGIQEVILPVENEPNVKEDLQPHMIEGLKLHFVRTVDQALEIALGPFEVAEKKPRAERAKEEKLQPGIRSLN